MKSKELIEIIGIVILPAASALGMWLNSRFATTEKKIDKEIQNLQQNHNLIILDIKEDMRQMSNYIKVLESENKLNSEKLINLMMEQSKLKQRFIFFYKIFCERTSNK